MIRSIPVPCCKPLRLIQLVAVTFCFTLLFFTRNYLPGSPILLPEYALVLLFTTFGTLLVLAAFEVFLQAIGHPTTNVPMVLVTVFGTVFCFVAGIVLMVFREIKSNSGHYRTLNVMALLMGVSFFCSIMYFLDTIILIRFL